MRQARPEQVRPGARAQRRSRPAAVTDAAEVRHQAHAHLRQVRPAQHAGRTCFFRRDGLVQVLGREDFVATPLPLLVVVSFLVGCLSILMGCGRVTMRTYYEASQTATYVVRNVFAAARSARVRPRRHQSRLPLSARGERLLAPLSGGREYLATGCAPSRQPEECTAAGAVGWPRAQLPTDAISYSPMPLSAAILPVTSSSGARASTPSGRRRPVGRAARAALHDGVVAGEDVDVADNHRHSRRRRQQPPAMVGVVAEAGA